MASVGEAFVFSWNDSHGFILHPAQLQQVGLRQGYETQATVSDAECHTLIRQARTVATRLSKDSSYQAKQGQ